jgi:hypothetical protein
MIIIIEKIYENFNKNKLILTEKDVKSLFFKKILYGYAGYENN